MKNDNLKETIVNQNYFVRSESVLNAKSGNHWKL